MAHLRLAPATAKLVALVPLFVIVGRFSVPRARRRWRRRHTVVPKDVPTDYFRTTPYTEKDAEIYDRADKAHEKILEWVSTSEEPILFFTGDSGTGKSSMLASYLLPKLGDNPGTRYVLLDRRVSNRRELWKAFLRPGDGALVMPSRGSTRTLLDRARAIAGSRLFVVVDQFEQVLVGNEPDAVRASFITDLVRSLALDPVDGVMLLLVVRRDYIPFLHDFVGGTLPKLHANTNWRDLKPFLPEHAKNFLRGGVSVPDELIDPIFRQIAAVEDNPDFVRPVTLNIVGLMLRQNREASIRYVLRTQEAGDLLHAYIRRRLREADQWGCARPVVTALIGPARTRVRSSVAKLAAKSDSLESDVLATLECLSEDGLVHPIGDDGATWEISHDFIARLFDDTLRTWHRSLVDAAQRVLLPASVAAVVTLFALPYVVAKPWYMTASPLPHPVGGETPLHFAAYMGDTTAARWLLAHGAAVEPRTYERQRTPLMFAAMVGDLGIVQMLAERGADPIGGTSEGETPLHLATWYGQADVASWLIDKGADVNATTLSRDDGRAPTPAIGTKRIPCSPLHFAVLANPVEVKTDLDRDLQLRMLSLVDILIRRGAAVDGDGGGPTPLACAVERGDCVMAKRLIRRGAKVAAANVNGHTALVEATRGTHAKRKMQELLAPGMTPEELQQLGAPPEGVRSRTPANAMEQKPITAP